MIRDLLSVAALFAILVRMLALPGSCRAGGGTQLTKDDEMEDVKLLPCPFCGGTDTTVEGKGMVWNGVKGYSDPQWYTLRHWGSLSKDDEFNRCEIVFRCRTEAEAIAAWNRP